MNTPNPCYNNGIDCPRRCGEPNCHIECAEYQAWLVIRAAEREREQRSRYNLADAFLFGQKKRKELARYRKRYAQNVQRGEKA